MRNTENNTTQLSSEQIQQLESLLSYVPAKELLDAYHSSFFNYLIWMAREGMALQEDEAFAHHCLNDFFVALTNTKTNN